MESVSNFRKSDGNKVVSQSIGSRISAQVIYIWEQSGFSKYRISAQVIYIYIFKRSSCVNKGNGAQNTDVENIGNNK